MNDFIDIHSHTLWEIDDGASDIQISVDMCAEAFENGTTTLFLTPHLMYWEDAEELFEERNEKAEELQRILDYNEIELELKRGFEILCDDDIFEINYFAPYTLCDSRYLLIEFDFFKPTQDDVQAWCKYILSCGVIPIVAHPERYVFVHENPELLNKLSDLGVLFQVNMGSLSGSFGEVIQNLAADMLNKGFVDFIGSDAHDFRIRNTDLAYHIENLPEECNRVLLEKALCENPSFIINNELYKPQRAEKM